MTVIEGSWWTSSMQQGWQCPKCQRIMAPSMMYCMFCQPVSESTTTGATITYEQIGYETQEIRRCINKKCSKYYKVKDGHTCESTVECVTE